MRMIQWYISGYEQGVPGPRNDCPVGVVIGLELRPGSKLPRTTVELNSTYHIRAYA